MSRMFNKSFKSFEEMGQAIKEKMAYETKKANKNISSKVKAKEDRIRAYRREASRKSSMANKRIERLEKRGLTDSPAYKKWVKDGSVRFGVRGKTYNEVQQEMARLDNFINSQTSTIRGVNKVLKNMADNTGIKYSNMKDLQQQSKMFFELSSKVEQYLRTVDDMASAVGYHKIWEVINQQVQQDKIVLDDSVEDVNRLVSVVGNAIREYDKPFESKVFDKNLWFELPKE